MRSDQGDIKYQFRRALIAIMNKIGSNGIVKINVAPVLRIKQFSNTGDGAEIVYEYANQLNDQLKQEAEIKSQSTGVDANKIHHYLDGVGTYFEWLPDMLAGFLNKTKDENHDFPIKTDVLDSDYVDSKDCLRAKNLPELVRGFNMMLAELDLLDKYKITLPPERGLGSKKT